MPPLKKRLRNTGKRRHKNQLDLSEGLRSPGEAAAEHHPERLFEEQA